MTINPTKKAQTKAQYKIQTYIGALLFNKAFMTIL